MVRTGEPWIFERVYPYSVNKFLQVSDLQRVVAAKVSSILHLHAESSEQRVYRPIFRETVLKQRGYG